MRTADVSRSTTVLSKKNNDLDRPRLRGLSKAQAVRDPLSNLGLTTSGLGRIVAEVRLNQLMVLRCPFASRSYFETTT